MTLLELIKKTSKGYEKDFPESPLLEQCQSTGKPLTWLEYQDRQVGDTLGRFIVIELFETFDPAADDKTQLNEAIRVMEMARRNLDNIIAELEYGSTRSVTKVSEQVDILMLIDYCCPGCGLEWQEYNDAACDSYCDNCQLSNIVPTGWKEIDVCIQVEYDLSYCGGDYDQLGKFTYIPVSLIKQCGSVEAAFQSHTGFDPQHIIRYSSSERWHNEDGNLTQL